MKVAIYSYAGNRLHEHENSDVVDLSKVQLVLGFGAKGLLADDRIYERLRRRFPRADIVLCSTSGEIFNATVLDDSVSVTAIEFADTVIRTGAVDIDDHANSYEAGIALLGTIPMSDDLCYMMVISDGGRVNGSELVNGIEKMNEKKVPVTGGLAGDGANFVCTLAGLNQEPVMGRIVIIGFYGTCLRVAHGSMGGWEMFGPEKTITRSKGNQLFEINREPALDIYKKYLGSYAEELPGSALLFPLSVKLEAGSEPVVRTILSIDTDTKSMVFAGDVPEGSKIRFMKANFDKLIDAASKAAHQAQTPFVGTNARFALLISCVGRKLILGSRVEEEVEAVHEALGGNTLMAGFYSYGEISPFSVNTKCELHNQTMTITTFDEK